MVIADFLNDEPMTIEERVMPANSAAIPRDAGQPASSPPAHGNRASSSEEMSQGDSDEHTSENESSDDDDNASDEDLDYKQQENEDSLEDEY